MHATRSEPATLRHLSIVLLVVLIATFIVRNLPWHLDDYDQAKQAFVSFEMVENGQWWFQHTPSDRVATKPPLAGWISAGLYLAFGGHGWEFAWRLPSFAATLMLLAMLWRCGNELAGPRGALIAGCAFGFNLLTPHLATLVRTDMLLTLLIFVAGWLVFEKVRRAEAWTRRERLWLSLAVLGSLLTKGPILYAFLLPGLVVYSILVRRSGQPNHAWAGWTPWFAPLLAFALWVGIGLWMSRDFYEQVVLKEFLGRFDMRDAPVHKHQPLWFYVPHLLHKWAPWSVALLALAGDRRTRAHWRGNPALLWLACWTFGGLVFMSLVPSKRVDRIFPIIPPLCLLVAALAEQWFCAPDRRRARLMIALVLVSGVVCTGYAISTAALAFREDRRGLVRFGYGARKLASARPERLAVVDSDDEGLLLYTGKTKFTKIEAALRGWQSGALDWLIIGKKDLREHELEFGSAMHSREAPPFKGPRDHYFLLERSRATTDAPANL
ncbi:MAG: glycosyltransferase family 39 protein [Chthoniobacteraceae bacterium]